MTQLNIFDPSIIAFAVVVNLVIALISWKAKLVDLSGVISGVIVGIAVYIAFNWEGFVVLFLFFFLGSLASKFKMKKKEQMGVAQKKGGQRGFKHVFANCGVAFFLAVAVLITRDYHQTYYIYQAAFIASLATALGDTISTELGQLYGKKCYLLITMERVPVGTEGAISVEGSVAGGIASLLLALIALALGTYTVHPIKTTVVITLAAIIANHIESILGGIFLQFKKKPGETALNFLNTAIGAALCLFFVS